MRKSKCPHSQFLLHTVFEIHIYKWHTLLTYYFFNYFFYFYYTFSPLVLSCPLIELDDIGATLHWRYRGLLRVQRRVLSEIGQ